MAKKTKPTPKKRSDSERRNRQAIRVGRQLCLLGILTGRGSWTKENLAAELADRMHLGKSFAIKTIERDIEVLHYAGVSVEDDGKSPKGYFVRRAAQFPVLRLTDDEIVGQATATAISVAAGLGAAPGAKTTTAKLGASSEKVQDLLQDAAAVMDVLDLKLSDHSQHREIIRTIQWALIDGKQLAAEYLSPYQEKPVKLQLIPYRLCLAHQAWYLIASAVGENRPKTYRVPRFKNLRPLKAVGVPPVDFSLSDYFGNSWGVYRGAETYDIEIEFTPEAAPLVCETQWHKSQHIVERHKDGRITLGFRVDGLEEVLWWVLGWTGRAQVIKPQELREMVVAQLQLGLSLNQGAPH